MNVPTALTAKTSTPGLLCLPPASAAHVFLQVEQGKTAFLKTRSCSPVNPSILALLTIAPPPPSLAFVPLSLVDEQHAKDCVVSQHAPAGDRPSRAKASKSPLQTDGMGSNAP